MAHDPTRRNGAQLTIGTPQLADGGDFPDPSILVVGDASHAHSTNLGPGARDVFSDQDHQYLAFSAWTGGAAGGTESAGSLGEPPRRQEPRAEQREPWGGLTPHAARAEQTELRALERPLVPSPAR